MKNIHDMARTGLRGGAALKVVALFGAGLISAGFFAGAAYAQETPPPAPQLEAPAADDVSQEDDTIVVTGSILRRETPSPVTTISAGTLDQRGNSTVQEAIQQLTSNNGPSLTNSFTANGAFGAGASSISLRGLSVNSTLVLFDGLRAAYYPLSDDGSRNFVDLNTIPDEIVERIDVLRDGASSSYGADAIAGVVNIITKRQYQGIGGRAEAGITERGDGGNYRLSLIGGTGDLDDDGYNVYASGFYLRNDALYNSDRPYPYNTDDQRQICNGAECGPNLVVNGLGPNGALPTSAAGVPAFGIGGTTFYVQPANAANTTAQGRYQILNPALGCFAGASYQPTAAELALNTTTLPTSQVCQEDLTQKYSVISPNIERFGGSARATVKLGDDTEAYMAFNFQQSTVNYTGLPGTIRGAAPTGVLFPQFSTASGAANFAPGSAILALPVFVCAAAVNCDTAADRRLNPNNPFAAQGQVARLVGRFPEQRFDETRSRVYRVAAGVQGTVGDGFDYKFNATAMHNDLRRTSDGYVYIANLLTSIGNGSYNFVNPSLNSAQTNEFLTPIAITDSSSDLYQGELVVSKDLFQLPGGAVQLGFGAAIRYEAVDAPSANPDTFGPTQRYFTLNAFGTSGDRTVYSGFAELNAPIFDQLEVNLSGRYDKYSSGQDAFSPKAGVLFRPIEQVTIRGTYSRGFRIPSFAEANALPTTGYVTVATSTLPDNFLAQYGCSQANTAACPAYITNYSRGLTTLASPDLEPEKSRSFTGGVKFDPIPQLSFTVDYYNIRKTGAITTPSNAPAVAAYFAGQAAPEGFNNIADAPDPNFPNALPRLAFVESALVNANTIDTEGLDFGATADFEFGNARFTSSATATWILNLSTTFQDGTTESYEGTLGNFNLTAGSGTPEWRINWQNTLNVEPFTISATANYFDGYDLSAEDQTGPGTAGQCGLAPAYVGCKVSDYVTVDLVGSVEIAERFTFYVNVLNLLDDLPPVDPVTYGAHLYNAVQGGTGILGRSFRAGVRVGL